MRPGIGQIKIGEDIAASHRDVSLAYRPMKNRPQGGRVNEINRIFGITWFLHRTIPFPGACSSMRGGSNAVLKEPALCSKIFLFNGVCGHPNYKYPGWPDVAIAVGAWEKSTIRIVAVSADAIVVSRWRAIAASIFAGNSFNNDPMTPLRYSTAGMADLFGSVHAVLHTEQHFSQKNGMQFPAGQPMPQTHLDVHITCDPNGARYSGNLSVWYVFDRQ